MGMMLTLTNYFHVHQRGPDDLRGGLGRTKCGNLWPSFCGDAERGAGPISVLAWSATSVTTDQVDV